MEPEFKGLEKTDSTRERELILKLVDNLRSAVEEDRNDDAHEMLDAIRSLVQDTRID